VHSIGATYQDMVDMLLGFGAVNACNMDGGSSTVMHYGGQYVNSCSADNGQPRPLPNAFLFK
jgi:exopolysaccharide biosynthesis protein